MTSELQKLGHPLAERVERGEGEMPVAIVQVSSPFPAFGRPSSREGDLTRKSQCDKLYDLQMVVINEKCCELAYLAILTAP